MQPTFHGYTQEALGCAFDRLLKKSTDTGAHRDWRAPIRARISPHDFEIFHAAVAFYTATALQIEPQADAKVGDDLLVTSIGYRAGPAGP